MNWPVGYTVACSDDGKSIVCLGRNVVVIDAERRQRASTSHPISNPSDVSFSSDGSHLAVKSTSGRIVLIDAKSGEVLRDYKNQKEGEGSQVCFSPAGDELIDGSWDGFITVRPTGNGAARMREAFPGEMIRRVSSDGDRLTWLFEHTPMALPGEQHPPLTYVSVRRWPFAPSTTRSLTFPLHIENATISPDGSQFCFIQKWDDRRVHIARISDGEPCARSEPTISGGTGAELAWSPDSRYIGSVQAGKFVFYRTVDMAVVGEVPCQYPSSVRFLPTGDQVILGSWKSSGVFRMADVLAGSATRA